MIEHEPDPLRRIPVKHADVRAEVGAVLRAARLKRGQSLENVAEQTRIPKRYIDALENDRLDEFPAFVYMRGFMKSYCEHLDLPFDEIWARVQATVSTPGAPETAAQAASALSKAAAPVSPAAPAPAPASAPARPAPAPARAPTPAHAPSTAHAAAPAAAAHPNSSSSAAGAVIFALALGIGGTVWVLHDRASTPAPKPVESLPRALLPVSKPVETRVLIRADDDCWARVAVDGATVFEGRIPRGASMDWIPTKSLTLRATVPSALEVTVNGAPHPLGAPSPEGEYRIDVP